MYLADLLVFRTTQDIKGSVATDEVQGTCVASTVRGGATYEMMTRKISVVIIQFFLWATSSIFVRLTCSCALAVRFLCAYVLNQSRFILY